MSFSRKHYIAIAESFKAQTANVPDGTAVWHTLFDLARDMADYFQQDNPRFQRDRFMSACGF